MIKEVAYVRVVVEFVISEREALRATGKTVLLEAKGVLRRTLHDGLSGNSTNCLDIEDVTIQFDDDRKGPSTRKKS